MMGIKATAAVVWLALVSGGALSGAFAQTTGTSFPPVTDTTAYPFQQTLDALTGAQQASPAVPSVSAVGAVQSRKPSAGTPAILPPAMPPAHVAVLGPAEKKALAIGNKLKGNDAMPVAGKEGRVTYTFGEGLPTIITSPLHVSMIELEPGETISGEPYIGDSTRWEVLPGTSGEGAETEPAVLLKPHETGLDTNIVITTNKRIYDLRLVSTPYDYIARVSFSYKEDEDARWKAWLADQEKQKNAREDAQVVTPLVGADAIDHLNFDYTVKGGDDVIRPLRVMDDGSKTYITMPDAALHQDLPALVVVNPRLKGEKSEEIVNYRVKGNLYIVDRLFDHAALLLGNGKTAEKVEIRRNVPLSGGVK